MNVIDVKNLDICYRTGYKFFYALKDINFCIKQGEYVCVVGDNGSGKSTLIKGILGLVTPLRGVINVNLRKDEISYLAQIGTVSTEFPATVLEVVVSGLQKASQKLPFYKKTDYKLAKNALEKVGIAELSSKLFFELSGGQQQRVLLARAICKKPKLLILDEPCNGLDPNISEVFYELLLDFNKNCGTTIFMVSHDIKKAEQYADKIIKLNKNLVFCGTPEKWKQEVSDGENK